MTTTEPATGPVGIRHHMTTARILTVKNGTGQPPRIAALALTPGLYLARGHRYCPVILTVDEHEWFTTCEDDVDWPASCPHRPHWAWRLITTAGLELSPFAFEQPVAAVRAAAADLARLPIPWTDTNPGRQRAAVLGFVRDQALDILRRFDRGAYTTAHATPGEREAA
ncbi:hypothetical protein FF86_101080 [Frankia sp. CpI1-P]|uniref:hypothetical protein n=1 Tax=Frankia sp. CpI1-P TaxID=1502734 RepID=UPI0006F20444|nr:hypothetical protein [Frankia sp. CpI1-P]KQM06203.1 hypothetical protein FF86_101080 [Frankia sp. CpI1-P]